MKNVLSRRATLRAGVIALIAGCVLAGSVTAANASSYSYGGYTAYQDSQAHWITASYDGMNVAIAGASTSYGTRAIQWYNNGGAEQKFYFDQVYDAYQGFEGVLLRDENSGMCLTTDGRAGDSLYQEPCNPATEAEWFWHYGSPGTNNSFQNRSTGLYLDVYGYSYGAGANIDLWYENNRGNQTFWVTNVSS